jgi:NADPH:quinone reductase-like Zn-dependent oxidoreductase
MFDYIIVQLKTGNYESNHLKRSWRVEYLVITDVPVPKVSDNEVLVKVKAIGINPVDIKTVISEPA